MNKVFEPEDPSVIAEIKLDGSILLRIKNSDLDPIQYDDIIDIIYHDIVEYMRKNRLIKITKEKLCDSIKYVKSDIPVYEWVPQTCEIQRIEKCKYDDILMNHYINIHVPSKNLLNQLKFKNGLITIQDLIKDPDNWKLENWEVRGHNDFGNEIFEIALKEILTKLANEKEFKTNEDLIMYNAIAIDWKCNIPNPIYPEEILNTICFDYFVNNPKEY